MIQKLKTSAVATRLTPPHSISHVLGSWLAGITKNVRNLISVGVAALLWAIWCTRDDMISEKKQVNFFMQAIFREAY